VGGVTGTDRPEEAEPDFDWSWAEDNEEWVPPDVDVTKPSIARMYDYYLGGKNNFASDREVGDKVLALAPDVRTSALANRAFLVKAVRLMAEAGVRQFIDLGTGIPTSPNVHEVAREVHPGAKVVYVDNDPIVTAHNRALRARFPGVITLQHDVNRPESILGDAEVRDLIDFGEPVGVLFVAVLHFVRLDVAPGVVARFRNAVPSGSYVAISAICNEGMEAGKSQALASVYSKSENFATYRTRSQIEQLFEGLELVEPGLADVTQWRAEGTPGTVRCLCGVGRKP
jgi:hypothetical protein